MKPIRVKLDKNRYKEVDTFPEAIDEIIRLYREHGNGD